MKLRLRRATNEVMLSDLNLLVACLYFQVRPLLQPVVSVTIHSVSHSEEPACPFLFPSTYKSGPSLYLETAVRIKEPRLGGATPD